MAQAPRAEAMSREEREPRLPRGAAASHCRGLRPNKDSSAAAGSGSPRYAGRWAAPGAIVRSVGRHVVLCRQQDRARKSRNLEAESVRDQHRHRRFACDRRRRCSPRTGRSRFAASSRCLPSRVRLAHRIQGSSWTPIRAPTSGGAPFGCTKSLPSKRSDPYRWRNHHADPLDLALTVP